MSTLPTEQSWQTNLDSEIETVRGLLRKAGYRLDTQQPHLLGERFLMQNISTTSGKKLILVGKDLNHSSVIIKATSDPAGKQELRHEQQCRTLLETIDFSYQPFTTPEEIAFWEDGPYLISVQTMIEQECQFLDRTIEEQFKFALDAFKTQESARATTSSHYKKISQTFGIRTSADYLSMAAGFLETMQSASVSKEVLTTCTRAHHKLKTERERIEQYCGFLTHTDFVPHNFKISSGQLYLLDTASLEFGNKYESWARFLNFMTLYNHQLERHLVTYVEQNRAPEERQSLQLMRLYRLIEIITYYVTTLQNSTGDLLTLNQARVLFWQDVLLAELENTRVDRSIVESYKILRDRLRTDEEKIRQINLH